jgi:hypothetical protein
MGYESPTFIANYFEVNFSRIKLPKISPNVCPTAWERLATCDILSSLMASPSKAISCKLIKNIDKNKMKANAFELSYYVK